MERTNTILVVGVGKIGSRIGLATPRWAIVMNPRLKHAGLSFQLSSPPKRDGLLTNRQRSDDRPHDVGPEARGAGVRPHSGCECFTRRQTTRRNHPDIRLSKSMAVCSRQAESALSASSIPECGGFPMDKRLRGSDSSHPLTVWASSEQLL